MNSDADRLWNELAPKYRRNKGLCRMTPEEAETAFNAAPEVPISDQQLRRMIDAATSESSPEWQPPTEWTPEEELIDVGEEMAALHREQGEETPETIEIEKQLREQLLSDDTEDEDGMDGGTAPPTEGR
jgi:hypothetical protein